MTTSELIKQLQRADPEGNLVININGALPFCVQTLPAYYDGDLFDLKRDEELNCYNVTEAILKRTGNKVEIVTLDLREVILENPELPVTLEGFSEIREKETLERIEAMRKEMRELHKCVQ